MDNKKDKTNIVECRFVDNRTDKVVYIKQYCDSDDKSIICNFWKKYFNDPDKNDFTFINCKFIQKNVEVDKNEIIKQLSDILIQKNESK